jgi:hypothetical protein
MECIVDSYRFRPATRSDRPETFPRAALISLVFSRLGENGRGGFLYYAWLGTDAADSAQPENSWSLQATELVKQARTLFAITAVMLVRGRDPLSRL